MAAGAGLLPWLRGVLAIDQALTLSGVLLAAILVTAVEARRSHGDHAALRLSFVADFCALLLLGPVVAAVSAACSACAAWLASPRRHTPHSHAIVGGAGGIVAMQFAGLTYLTLGGTTVPFTWPSQAVAMLGAVAGYCALTFGWFEILMPFVAGRRPRPSWLAGLARSCSNHVLGASAAAVVAELVGRRSWAVLFLAAIPLSLAYRAHRAHEAQAASGRRRDTLFDSVNLGVCTLDGGGVVIDWNEALERLTGCPRADAVGRPLMSVLPGLGQTRLPQVIQDALRRQSAQCLAQTGLTTPAGPRLLDVTVVPDVDVVTLHWDDATERAGAEQQLKRAEERLALVADGASDGLWELDLRSQSLFVSGPWCAMVGLGGQAATTTSAAWFDRVHPEDLPGLRNGSRPTSPANPLTSCTSTGFARRMAPTAMFCVAAWRRDRATGRATRIGGSMTDQTDRQGAQERIRDSMFRDPLTGLLNRTVFVEGLGRRLQDFKNRRGDSFAVLYLDLDRFKVVNDSLGHLVGDELLVGGVAAAGDVPARRGLAGATRRRRVRRLLNGLGDGGQANAIAYRIQESLSAPFSIGGPRGLHVGQHRHRLQPARVRQPGRDHARRRHGDVPRQGAGQGPARGVRRRHARAGAGSVRLRERSAPRRQGQGVRRALPADRVADLGRVHRLRGAGALEARRPAGVSRDLHARGRGTGHHRTAGHLGAPGGVPHVRGVAGGDSPTASSSASRSTCPRVN